MTSIPADPTITLGNIVSLEKIDQLMQIAEAQKPQNLANDRLNGLILSTYKIDMIEKQMVNMKIQWKSLEALRKEKQKLKVEMAESAVELAQATIKTEEDVRNLKMAFAQQQISFSAESPINWETSAIKAVPISYDSLKFDVQFFQFMGAEDKQSADSSSSTSVTRDTQSRGAADEGSAGEAHGSRVASYVSDTLASMGDAPTGNSSKAHTESAHSSSQRASTENTLDGTVVIVAKCTHKSADVMAPCVLDARKSVAAWNFYYPDEYVSTDAREIFKAAGIGKKPKPPGKDKKVLHLLSGVSRGSSFVGYAHITKIEKTSSSTSSQSTVTAVAETLQSEMFMNSLRGNFGSNSTSGSTASNLMSTSSLQASCSLTCEGVIPSIVANDMGQVVQGLNPDPSQVMSQLDAINNQSSSAVSANTSVEAGAGDAANGARFMELNESHLSASATALAEKNTVQNKIIDMNTMMTAFSDYVTQAAGGGVGIPINYFIKELTKEEIAKVYIRKFYPNGATNQKDAMAGALGGNVEGGSDTQ